MSSIRFSMQIEEQLEKDYKEAIQSKYSDDDVDSAIKKAIDTFQIDLKCCRFNNISDWVYSRYHNTTGSVPESCCIERNCHTKTGTSKCNINNFQKKVGHRISSTVIHTRQRSESQIPLSVF